MTEKMYQVDGLCSDNETLVVRLQAGDITAAPLLLSQNKKYLTSTAKDFCFRYDIPSLVEDLKQEGAVALIDAAKRYVPGRDAKFLTYAASTVRSAMLDYLARSSRPMGLPPSRYHQLRRVSYLCASAPEGTSNTELADLISREEKVSKKVAGTLLTEYRTIFGTILLGDEVFSVSGGSDPAKLYDTYMRKTLLLKLIEKILRPRELNIVRYHLGLGMPDEKGMTFEQLAILFNYNGPSAAEKAYKAAVKKIREHLNQGEYGAWVSAKRMIQEAQHSASVDSGYSSPQVTWADSLRSK